MPNPVPPPRHGLVADGAVDPRPDWRLVPDVMEARDCSKPAAEAYIDEHGRAGEGETEASVTGCEPAPSHPTLMLAV